MKNGAFAEAQFNHPVALTYMPGDKIAVVDNQNFMIRLLDLKTKTVSTLVGTGTRGDQDGKALVATLDSIWNMVYMPTENRLYFTQPAESFRRLDLATGLVEHVLTGDPQVRQ